MKTIASFFKVLAICCISLDALVLALVEALLIAADWRQIFNPLSQQYAFLLALKAPLFWYATGGLFVSILGHYAALYAVEKEKKENG